MTRKLLAIALLLLCGIPAQAHRLDEYLQATLLTVHQDHLDASMRLIPGVAVSTSVIAAIDTDRDGLFSPREQRAYAQRVLADLALTQDATPLPLKLTSFSFPTPAQMHDGLGEIHIDFIAPLPALQTPTHQLLLQNHHQTQTSVYPGQRSGPERPIHPDHRPAPQRPAIPLRARLPPNRCSSPNARKPRGQLPHTLPSRHNAHRRRRRPSPLPLSPPPPRPAPDLTLPLVPPAPIRPTLLRILKIVTAFTLGHSLTLALAAWSIVSAPSRPIEVLIAVSILISAAHALRPIFPGKEAAIAAFFGLIHGLAFAATLTSLGLQGSDRLFGLLAFNLGIETMQLLVVALTMPSLILLSRTRAYPSVRVAGALLAATAALAWIADRLFDTHTPIDALATAATHHVPWLAAALFVASLICLRPFHHPVK